MVSRMLRRVVLAVGLMALLAPATASAAGNWSASAFFEYGNAACGNHIEGAPLLGTVEFTKAGGKLSLRVELDGAPATADTDYILTLWDGATCEQIGGEIATIHTDSFGVGGGTFVGIKTKGVKSFFATLYNDAVGWNDSTIVP